MGQGDNPVGLDHNTLRMFEAFNLYMRQQNVEQRKEALTRLINFMGEMFHNTSEFIQEKWS